MSCVPHLTCDHTLVSNSVFDFFGGDNWSSIFLCLSLLLFSLFSHFPDLIVLILVLLPVFLLLFLSGNRNV